MKREDLYLVKIIIVWFVFLIFYKNFLKLENETEIFRMKKYNSLNFSLIPVEEKNEDNVVFHHSHSEILKYPPNLKKYPLIKNAKSISITLNAGEALYIPAFWWHWVRSEKRCFAVSNICEIHPISNYSQLCKAKSLFLKSEEMNKKENVDENYIILSKKINEKGTQIYENYDFSKHELREINENDLNSELFTESVINSVPVKISMNKYFLTDKNLVERLTKKNLNVLVSTNNTITNLEKPNWENSNGVKPGVKIINCNYLNYLKLTKDPIIFAYVGMSPVNPNQIDYNIPDFWEKTFENKLKMTSIWISHKNIETGLHYDNSDNLLHVVSGKKNIILFPPSETKLLYKKVMKKHNGKMLFNDFK